MYSRLSVAQGLASNNVKDVLRDRRGFVWAGTVFGLQRYDGIRFTTVSVSHTNQFLPVGNLKEDSQGNIWFRHGDTRLSVIRFTGNGHLHDTALAAAVANETAGPYDIGPNDEIAVFAGYRQLLLYHIATRKLQRFDMAVNPSHTKVKWLSSHRLAVLEPQRVRIYELTGPPGNRGLRLLQQGRCNHPAYSFNSFYYQQGAGRLIIFVMNMKKTGRLKPVLFTGQPVVQIRPGSPVLHVKELQNCVYKNDSLALLYAIDGLFQYNVNTGGLSAIKLRNTYEYSGYNERVMAVYPDRENNVWICPASGGILLVKNTQFAISTWRLPAPDGKKLHIRSCGISSNGRLLAGIDGHGLFELQYGPQEQTVQLKPLVQGVSRINTIYTGGGGRIWAGINQHIYLVHQGRVIRRFATGATWCINTDDSGHLWAGTSGRGIYRWHDTAFTLYYRQGPATQPVFGNSDVVWRLLHLQHRLMAATDSGIVMLDKKTGRRAIDNQGRDLMRQTGPDVYWGLCPETDSTVLAACINNKLLRLYINTGRVDTLLLERMAFYNIIKDSSHTFWVTTDRGVLRYQPQNQSAVLYGLEDNLVNLNLGYLASLNLPGNRLLFAGTGGFSIINTSLLQPVSLHVPEFTGFEVFNSYSRNYLQPESHTYLKYSQNSFRVQFASPGMQMYPAAYEYMLENHDRQWIRADNSAATYSNLKPGRYRLLVRVAALNSGSPAVTGAWIHVATPYWKSFGFRAGIALAVLLAFALPLWLRYRYQREKNLKRMQVQELEVKTLRSQLNPHFIFNALNSIQYFIIKNDKEAANNYLSRFSVLMRTVLQSSRLPAITLAAEAGLLSRYLEMESLRFDGQIEWQVTLAPGTDATLEIASMMIQPVVENAVVHGLMPKGGRGRITVLFEQEQEYIRCTVTDNGAGRRPPAAQNGAHNSSGLALLRERLALMNRMYGKQGGIELKFLFEQDIPAGANVILRLPVIQSKTR